MRSAVCSICNVSLTNDHWLQASLTQRNGGIGLRCVSWLASSAFLASTSSARELQDHINASHGSCNTPQWRLAPHTASSAFRPHFEGNAVRVAIGLCISTVQSVKLTHVHMVLR